jgi:hypothetical protein
MDTKQILTELDNEIEKLTYVRALLTNTGFDGKPPAPKRSALSAEGRKHIVDAQRKRWAKAKKPNRQPNKPPTGG